MAFDVDRAVDEPRAVLVGRGVVGRRQTVVLLELEPSLARTTDAHERAQRRAMVLRHDHRLAHPGRARRSRVQRRRAGQSSAYVQSGCFDQNRSS